MGSLSVGCPVCGGRTATVKDINNKYPGYFIRKCISQKQPECSHVGLYERKKDDRQPEVEMIIDSSEEVDPFTKLLYCKPVRTVRYYYSFVRSISPSGMRPVHGVFHPALRIAEIE